MEPEDVRPGALFLTAYGALILVLSTYHNELGIPAFRGQVLFDQRCWMEGVVLWHRRCQLTKESTLLHPGVSS